MKNSNIPELTEQRWKTIAHGFKRYAHFPNCLGAVDGNTLELFVLKTVVLLTTIIKITSL